MTLVAQDPDLKQPVTPDEDVVVVARGAGSPNTPRPRLQYGDPLRVCGSMAVVVLHLAMEVTEDPGAVGSGRWWFCAACDGAVRWAVPAFLMLSGALLLEPHPGETTSRFYAKRGKRLGVVLLFWPLFYLAWRRLYLGQDLSLRDGMRDLLVGEPFHHLHFLFALPGLYFLTPMLRVYTRHAPTGQFRLLTVVVLGVTVLAGLVQEIRGIGVSVSQNALTRFLPYLGFFLAGYALKDVVLSRRGMALAAAGFVASVGIYAAGTAWLVERFYPHPFAYYFVTQYSLTRVLGGICAFLLLASLFRRGVGWRPLDRLVSRWLAPASLGIYLIHPVFISLFQAVGVGVRNQPVWLALPLAWACVWTASLAATLLLQRLPYVGRIVG